MLLLFLFFPRGVFIQFFFHCQSRACGEAERRAEVFGGDPQPVSLIPAVAGLTAVGTLMDEDEDAEEKRRRMEAKIAAENFGAVIGFAAGAALAVKEKLDEHAAREEQKKQQHEQTMGGL